jgi:hypothetical protein
MIEAVHEGICAALRAGLPGLQDVVDYGVEDTLQTPLAVVRLAGMERAGEADDGTERLWVTCRWEVFLVLAARVPGVERELRRMAETVAGLTQGNRFGVSAMPAQFLAAGPNEFEPTFSGALAWRVEFEQDVPVGESVWEGEGVPVEQVMVSYVPLVGAEHEDKYTEVTDELPDI